MPLCVRLPLS
ncbi:hypothetical protein, conserved [Leishmania donovani]|uniref:Uncharacterized protein n=1 Tax=Leishmania donovani TaxID=5661 RepID=E9BEY5_LEIDO|nr:hypothetical protein, conserved [Leishmania donovani]